MVSLPNNDSDWAIEFHFQNTDDVVRVPVDNQLMVGRTDPTQTVFNGLDLTPFGGGELGVSRKHAVIRWQGPQLFIYDMDSGNGTVLNGTRLQPNIGYRLADGDSLYIGHLPIKIRLNTDIGQSSIRARRIELDIRGAPTVARGQRILLVEDDTQIAQLYRTALENAGFTVQISRDVVGAMRALHGTPPSLILLDLMLPGVHGLELCRYIRRDAETMAIPIVVVSALSDAETIKSAIDSGVDVYMSKPINLKELARVGLAIIQKNEIDNPTMHTKQLRGTASLDAISAGPRNDTVVIFVEGVREPIGAIVQPYLTFGRKATGAQNRSHVDLEPYGAFDKGVSRVHARLKRTRDGFVVEDLGSANGTYINGKPLLGHEERAIANGDELRLGELRMHVYLLSETVSASAAKNEAK